VPAPIRPQPRRAELARLDALLDDVRAGHFRSVQLTGEPGIGKTHLLEVLRQRARERGFVALSGRADEFDLDLPFGVFAAALGADRALLDEPDLDHYQLARRIRDLLDSLAGGAGLVLTLDDLHWADPGSIDLLDHLLRHPPRGPVLLAWALRDRQAPARLWEVLAQDDDDRTRLELAPLTPGEMDELLGPGLSVPRRHALHVASGGNPFYLDTLARAAGPPGGEGVHVDIGLGDAALRPVLGALAGELASLSAPALRVGQAAAVAGDIFDPEMIAAVGPVPVDQALAGLDELAARDVVRAEATARGFRFRHPLVRNAVYHTADPAWLRAAHARAAAQLRQRGAAAALRAHHVERSAIVGDEEAITVLVEAAENAALTAPAVAAHWFGVAATFLGDADQRRHVLALRRARAIGSTGRFADSRDLLRDLLPLIGDDRALQAEATTLCAGMERLLGRHEESLALLTSTLDSLADRDTAEAHALKLELAIGSVQGGRLLEALDWINQVLSGAGRPGRTLETAGATGLLALGHAYAGDYDQAKEHLREAMSLLDGVPDGELAKHLGVIETAWGESILHRYHDARRHFARGVAMARRTGQYPMLAPLLFGLCTAETWLGNLAEAREHAEAGVELARTLSERSQFSAVLGGLAEVAYQEGELAEAEQHAKEAIRALPPGTLLWSGHAEGVLARVRLAMGDPEGCREVLLRAGGGPDLPAYQPGMRPPWYDVLVQAELALGRPDAAAAWADRVVALPPVFGVEQAHRLTEARIFLASGRAGEAADLAGAAADYYHGVGMRIIEGDARHIRATALTAVGDHPGAQDELRRAKELFAACGAGGMHARVVADQRRIGAGRPRARKGDSVANLTEREVEIAGLAAAGHSNREIGDKLGLSPKTVQTHLSRVFDKLGVTSRTGLAGRLTTRPD
jgi:DNA-binding CsgD family transcriptional regulator/Tfp pilus assembly protein PilF